MEFLRKRVRPHSSRMSTSQFKKEVTVMAKPKVRDVGVRFKEFSEMHVLRLAVLALGLVACAPPAVDTAADEQILREKLQAWYAAANAHDLEALVTHYDDRAVLMAANRPTATGTDAIREYFLAEWESAVVQVSGEVDEAHVSGDFAMLRGSWTATITPSDGSPSFDDAGSFVEVYRRQEDGSWRSVWDIWNSELPLPS